MQDGGTYLLILELDPPIIQRVGALGQLHIDAEAAAYVGSAEGSGGFARIDRHREVAAGERATRHWHIDYLLAQADVEIGDVVRFPGASIECELAAAVTGRPVPKFGCSDCGCRSHLFLAETQAAIQWNLDREQCQD